MNSDGRSGVKKFDNKNGDTCTHIWDDNDYYSCGGCGDYGYYIHQIDTNDSCINDRIADYFEGIETTTLTGNSDDFTTKRVIIIEMK